MRVVSVGYTRGKLPGKAAQYHTIAVQIIACFQKQIHVKFVCRTRELCIPAQNQNPAKPLLIVFCGQY